LYAGSDADRAAAGSVDADVYCFVAQTICQLIFFTSFLLRLPALCIFSFSLLFFMYFFKVGVANGIRLKKFRAL